jgi:hypothetical protein
MGTIESATVIATLPRRSARIFAKRVVISRPTRPKLRRMSLLTNSVLLRTNGLPAKHYPCVN